MRKTMTRRSIDLVFRPSLLALCAGVLLSACIVGESSDIEDGSDDGSDDGWAELAPIRDRVAPTITIASPASGAVVFGAVEVLGTASDNTEVSRVEVRVDDGAWQRAEGTTSFRFVLATAAFVDGSHTVSARARDAARNVTTTSVAITISNGAAAMAPTSTAPPVISGSAVVGQTLTASAGSWNGTAPITFSYQWQQCDAGGAACADLAGATTAMFTLTTAQLNATMRVAVTGSNSAGALEATSAASAVVSGGAASTCAHPTLCLDWPVPGQDARTWAITNYVDRDPTSGVRDYHGGTKVSNGHNGIDIAIANFRVMDAGVPVNAAAAGTVIQATDGNYDRNTSCSGTANGVVVRHADGSRAIYAHFKNGSVAVAVGQVVARGQQLGLVGSSGCSSGPHLHFELRDAANVVLDPFALGMWKAAPIYDTVVGIMDTYIKASSIGADLTDPAPNITSIAAGSTVHVGLDIGGGKAGDVIAFRLRTPSGTIYRTNAYTFTQTYTHSWWIIYPAAIGTEKGIWKVESLANGVAQATYPLMVP